MRYVVALDETVLSTFESIDPSSLMFILDDNIVLLNLISEKLHTLNIVGIQCFVERYISKVLQLSFFNIQVSALSKTHHPIKVVGDILFCLNSGDEVNMNQLDISNKGNLAYLGQLKYLNFVIRRRSNHQLAVILYVTQPNEANVAPCFLKGLVNWCQNQQRNVDVLLRVYPLHDRKSYEPLVNIQIIENTETVLERVKRSSLLLYRASSVLFDALSCGISSILSFLDEKINLCILPNKQCQITSIDAPLEKTNNAHNFSALYQECLVEYAERGVDYYSKVNVVEKFFSHMRSIT